MPEIYFKEKGILINTTHENEFQLAALLAEKTQILKVTQGVANTFVPLNNARSIRNNTMYNSEEKLE